MSQEVTLQRPEKQLSSEEIVELAGTDKPCPFKHQLPIVKATQLQKGPEEKTTDFILYLHQRSQAITLMMLSVASKDEASSTGSPGACQVVQLTYIRYQRCIFFLSVIEM